MPGWEQKYYDQLPQRTGGTEWTELMEEQSILDGRYTADELRLIANLMDQMKVDPENPRRKVSNPA